MTAPLPPSPVQGPAATLAARARFDFAALALGTALILFAGLEEGLAAAPQALAASAVLLLGARAEVLDFGLLGRVALLGACAAFAFLPGGTAPLLLARFLSAVTAVSLLKPKATGEQGFLLTLSLLEASLAAALASHWTAGLGAVLFTWLALRTLGSWHAHRSSWRAAVAGGPVVAVPDARGSSRAAERATVAVLAVAAPLFLVLPRAEAPVLRFPGLGRSSEPAVGEEVRLGRLGPLADPDEVVGRVAPLDDAARAAEPYFRAVALDRFDGQGWSSVLRERRWIGFDAGVGRAGVAGYAVPPGAPRYLVDVAATASPRLPLPEHAASLDFRDPIPSGLLRDEAGTVRVVSARPVARLVFEVATGVPVAPEVRWPALPPSDPLPERLREELAPAVRAVLERIPPSDDAARARALTEWVRSSARYSLTGAPSGPDPVGDFLFRTKAGHCKYFASALAASLRQAGIPARLVAGYHASRWNDVGEFWVLRRRDAHAWVEAFLRGSGWTRFDATPPAVLGPDPYAGVAGFLTRLRDAIAFAWNQHVLGYDPAAQRAVLDSARRVLARTIRSIPWRAVGAAFFALGAVLAATVLARRLARRRRARGSGARSPVAFYARALVLLRRRGVRRRPGETPSELAARARAALAPPAAQAVHDLTRAFEGVRYGGAGPPPADVADAWLRRLGSA